jgi:hypothetical protein
MCYPVERLHGTGSFSKGLFRFVKPLLLSCGKGAPRTGGNMLTDIVQRKPDKQVSTAVMSRVGEVKYRLEQIIWNLIGSGLQLKRKRKQKMSLLYQTPSKSIKQFRSSNMQTNILFYAL